VLRPDWVIPAVSALNLAGPGAGYRRGLSMGANLTTINLTPTKLRGDYLLYKRDRFIMNEERILQAIAEEGLVPSTRSLADYYYSRKVNGSTRAQSLAEAPARLSRNDSVQHSSNSKQPNGAAKFTDY
jgi:biotin synthase